MSTEDNKASVRKAYEALNQHNSSLFIEEFIDPNFIDHGLPPGLSGIEGSRQFVGMLLTVFQTCTSRLRT